MNFNKVILYYGFAPISDPAAVKLWQKISANPST